MSLGCPGFDRGSGWPVLFSSYRIFGIPVLPVFTLAPVWTEADSLRAQEEHLLEDCERSDPFSGRGNYPPSSGVKEGEYAGRWILGSGRLPFVFHACLPWLCLPDGRVRQMAIVLVFPS